MARRFHCVLAVVALVALAGCSGALSGGVPTDGTTTAHTSETPDGTSTPTTSNPNGTLSVHFLNVGQGSSALLVGPTGETMLVDTGDWSDDGADVIDYLEAHDVERVDYLVTTHADADHIGGHEAVIDYFETQGEGVGAVYDPGIASSSRTYEEYLDAVVEYDVTLYEAREGDEIPLKGVDADVLAPPEGYLADEDRNENSLVVRVGFGESTFLLAGDGETASEQFLAEEYGDGLDAFVLSAGHHGSQSSSGGEFLDAVDPRIAVISSAYDSQYGHPHEDVLGRFAERSVRTYWTATHGNVQLTTNGSAVLVETQRDAPTAPLELRDSDPIEPGSDDETVLRTVLSVDGSTQPPGTTVDAPAATTEGTAQPASLSVVDIHADAEGNDNDNLNDEYVVFENAGDDSLDLGGWTVADDAGHTYTVPDGITLDPGARVTLHTGSGTNAASELYWGADSAIWNNDGDTVTVRTDSGDVVLEETYS